MLPPPGKQVAVLGWTTCVPFPFLLVGFGGVVLHISVPPTLSKDSDPGVTGHPWWHLHLLSVGSLFQTTVSPFLWVSAATLSLCVCVAGVLQRLYYHEAGRPFRVVHRTVMGVLFPFFLCRCKPRITGQRCDRCAPGFHHFPECVPCSCHRDGTEPDVCDPGTGACVCKVKQVLGCLGVLPGN